MSGLCGKLGGDGKSVGTAKLLLACFSFFFPLSHCMGVLLPPSLAHSAPWRAMDLICSS